VFNEGCSKTLYCIAATILEIDELENVLEEARMKSKELDIIREVRNHAFIVEQNRGKQKLPIKTQKISTVLTSLKFNRKLRKFKYIGGGRSRRAQ
jgi:hypothetical protein